MKLETKYMLFGLVLKVLESPLTSCGLFYLKIHAAGIKPLSVLDFVLMKIGSVRFVITHSWCMLVFRMCDNKSHTSELILDAIKNAALNIWNEIENN